MLKKIINKVLSRVGYRITKATQSEISALDRFFATWAELGTSPSFILDIGANHGDWTRMALQWFPGAKILMIEPQERLRVFSGDVLGNKSVSWKTMGISDEIGIMKLSLPPRDDSASFVLSEEAALALGFPVVEVPVTTIDALVADSQQIPEMIKIDAEGFDLKALHGANSVLGKTEVILVECAVACQGLENTLENILPLMWSKGYRVIDITDLNHSPKNGVLWLTELVFVLTSSPIWKKLKEY